jgi:hypothetical protein
MSQRLIAAAPLAIIFGVDRVTIDRRMAAGRFGPVIQEGRHRAVSVARAEALLGRSLSDLDLERAYRGAQAKWMRAYRKRHPYKDLPTLDGDPPLKGEAGYSPQRRTI